jgi:hypothetical protein
VLLQAFADELDMISQHLQRARTRQPVQAPTKYKLVINLKDATVLGVGAPTVLARADEMIE